MREIHLKPEGIAIVDDADFEIVNQFTWYYNKTSGYAQRASFKDGKRKTEYLHQVIAQKNDSKFDVDHINRNKLDNRRENLRIVSRSTNQYNSVTYKTNTSGVRGVSLIKSTGKWRAAITKDYKAFNLGHFDTKELAHAAYLSARSRLAPVIN